MTVRQSRRSLIALCTTFGVVTLTAIAASAQTTAKSTYQGTPQVTTEKLSGTVVQVEGNQLLVKLTSGEIRMFNPPPDQKFVIDGKDVKLSDLQPGTKLNATYTETRTPITERTVETVSGKVFYVAAPTVILTLANGENRQFVVKDNVKFHHSDGRDMTVFDLRQGMRVSAEKVTEAPKTELVTTRTITGTAPSRATADLAPSRTPADQPAPAATTAAPSRTSAQQPAAPAAEKATAAPPSAAAPPARLPKTASLVPLVGLIGLLLIVASFGLRRYRLQ